MNGVFFQQAAAFAAAIAFGHLEVGKAALDGAKVSVELAIGLIGYIALMGLMKVVERAAFVSWRSSSVRFSSGCSPMSPPTTPPWARW